MVRAYRCVMLLQPLMLNNKLRLRPAHKRSKRAAYISNMVTTLTPPQISLPPADMRMWIWIISPRRLSIIQNLNWKWRVMPIHRGMLIRTRLYQRTAWRQPKCCWLVRCNVRGFRKRRHNHYMKSALRRTLRLLHLVKQKDPWTPKTAPSIRETASFPLTYWAKPRPRSWLTVQSVRPRTLIIMNMLLSSIWERVISVITLIFIQKNTRRIWDQISSLLLMRKRISYYRLMKTVI